jgi:hypothetical protein
MVKQFSLLLFTCLAFSLNAQIKIIDFEDNGLVPPKPDCNPTAEWIGDPNLPLVTLETNPDTTGNNTPSCVKYVETVSSNQGNSLQLAFDGTTATTGHNLIVNKYVGFMIYSENQTNFDINLELGAGGTPHYSLVKNVTVALNTWTLIEFDFTGNDPAAVVNSPSGWISNIRIHFNDGTPGSGDVYYVDEYFMSPTSTTVIAPSAPLSIFDFQDDGAGLPDCYASAEWVNDPNAPVATVEANPNSTNSINPTSNSAKYVETMGSAAGNSLQLAFNGTTARTGHDLVANKFVKFMVYSENQTNFDIDLELGTGGTPHFSMNKNITVALNTWTEVEFDFSGADPTAVINNATGWISNIRIHFNLGTAGAGDVYYVDEYFISQNSTIGSVFVGSTGLFQSQPLLLNYDVTNGVFKKLETQISTLGDYANFSLYADNQLILDNIDVPAAGTYNLNAVVEFPNTGNSILKLVATNADLVIQTFSLTDYSGNTYPTFTNETDNADIVDETSLKYGGPSIADMDNDGDYDMVLNNHNDSPSKLYWNDGDGTFTKQPQDLSLWNQMDLHGSAAGDYDNDGDLDLVISIGGGNGTSPAPPVFYRNDNGIMTRVDDQIGITSGARGRSPRWSDMDMDGDLDLMLINAAGINGAGGVQHIFYENKGDGTFQTKNIAGLENADGEKLLITDFNNDQIDDVLMLSPLTAWQGNGDFTFTNVSLQRLPGTVVNKHGTVAATDIDIDNDGDLDLYLSRGVYYFWLAESNSVDFISSDETLDALTSGSQGTLPFEVTATGSIVFHGLDFTVRNNYAGGVPLYLGTGMTQQTLSAGTDDTLVITQAMATGWPATRANNGIYIGYVGNGVWKFETVRNTDILWSIHFSLDSVTSFTPDGWSPLNRNADRDILLRNDGTTFSDITDQWNVPFGGNHWGATRGDFNNDGLQDLYVHRRGFLKKRVSDYIMMNTGSGFEISTSHDANNAGTENHGDMGQAFDYDLDGNVDLLNGDDGYGLWHLYKNAGGTGNNHSLVRVNYSPVANVDPISAVVVLHTPTQTYRKRVGSAGEAHSQSLLNIVHFGLGQENQIDSVVVTWRNGETKTIVNPSTNQVIKASEVVYTENLVDDYFNMGEFYPNPSQTGIINLDYNAVKNEKVIISVFDASGRATINQTQQIMSGSNTLNLNLNSLPKGLYIIRIGNDENATFRKLLIE